ncbi:hypothetical protein EN871_14820 [bacterium M00.F.Ca.ET.228.01.1.1]|nr:hypothetical protein EN871_14820 [bacterium M00.F.Ca.ET.228.01.1.1]TGS00539.1 hypothetical protein EN834_14815 [bacterium M00.F.Ca.ET.191.01.1.1]TGU04925.1 hypothetical protein EN798_15635 [bacterium M00.F.Ca.ET.155.01.1.1]
MNDARPAGRRVGGAVGTSTATTLLRWRMRAYAGVVGHAAARHAKTLALVVGVFVFGLPLKAQLDLLSAPLTLVFAPGGAGLVGAGALICLSVVAVALVAVQADAVFGGAARRWSMSLPGGAAAHRTADAVVTGTALWPFGLMLAALLVRHALGGDRLAAGVLFPVAAVMPVLWMAAPLIVVARSRAAWAPLAAGLLFVWLAARGGGVWALPAFVCACAALALARSGDMRERAHAGAMVLRSGRSLMLAWAVLLNRYGHSLRLGALMLVGMGGLSVWLVYTPDYASRSWGIANFIVPFVVYQIGIMHAWMRDEADAHSAGWLGSLPNAVVRFKRCSAAVVIGLSLACVIAFVLVFGMASHAYARFAGAFMWYSGLVLALAVCRWWGPRKSRVIDSLLAVGIAIACFSN